MAYVKALSQNLNDCMLRETMENLTQDSASRLKFEILNRVVTTKSQVLLEGVVGC